MDTLAVHCFEKDAVEKIYSVLWGGPKVELEKVVTKANKREKKKEEKFVPSGIDRPQSYRQLFSKKYKEQCDATGEKYSFKGLNDAWNALSKKEQAKYKADAEKLKNEYIAEQERQKGEAIKNGTHASPEPKRPISAYFHFLEENRADIAKNEKLLAEFKTNEDGKVTTANQQITKAAGKLWRELPEKKKAKYEEKYKKDKERYLEELAAWKEKETERKKKLSGKPEEVKIESSGSKKKATPKKAAAESDAPEQEANATEPESDAPEPEPTATEPESDSQEQPEVQEPVKKGKKNKEEKPKAEKAEKAKGKGKAKAAVSDAEE
jgi:hypothetical protein